MVRRGWCSRGLAALAVGVLLAACGDDGGGDEEADELVTTAPPTSATLPDEVEPGTGYLVLDGEATLLSVRNCALEPVTDPATGVVTELAIDADDGIGRAVSLTRSLTPGDVPTRSDVVTIADQAGEGDPEILEAERAETGGRYIDLLAEGAITPLLAVDGETVTGDGVFGPFGARPGSEGLVEGSVIVRCPPAG